MARKKLKGPLDQEQMRSLALFYVGRYATTTAKLEDYLRRKVMERGWEDDGEPDYGAVVQRLAELRYVDDDAFAVAKSEALKRRGFGQHRIKAALHAAGIKGLSVQDMGSMDPDEAVRTALILARRKRIGPFSSSSDDPALRSRWMAALMRAGHSPDTARKVLAMTAEDLLCWDRS